MDNTNRFLDVYQLADSMRSANILNSIMNIYNNKDLKIPLSIYYFERSKNRNYSIIPAIAMTLSRMKIEGEVNINKLKYKFDEVYSVIKDFKSYLELCDTQMNSFQFFDLSEDKHNIIITDDTNFKINPNNVFDTIFLSTGQNKTVVKNSDLFRYSKSLRIV